MKLRWTERAAADLASIRAFIEEEVGVPAAPILKSLILHAERITTFPNAGRVVPEFASESVREVIDRPFRLIYRVGDEAIDVLAVRHSRRLLHQEDLE